MKTKWFFVYIGVGVAFAAASLWVCLSGGKSAKAIRAKYRLGGILLTTWALLSAASCNGTGPGPFGVNCYDAAPPMEYYQDRIYVQVKDYGGTRLKSGDVILVFVNQPTYAHYSYRLQDFNNTDKLIQEGDLTDSETVEDEGVQYQVVLGETEFKGDATILIFGESEDKPKNQIGSGKLTIL